MPIPSVIAMTTPNVAKGHAKFPTKRSAIISERLAITKSPAVQWSTAKAISPRRAGPPERIKRELQRLRREMKHGRGTDINSGCSKPAAWQCDQAQDVFEHPGFEVRHAGACHTHQGYGAGSVVKRWSSWFHGIGFDVDTAGSLPAEPPPPMDRAACRSAAAR